MRKKDLHNKKLIARLRTKEQIRDLEPSMTLYAVYNKKGQYIAEFRKAKEAKAIASVGDGFMVCPGRFVPYTFISFPG